MVNKWIKKFRTEIDDELFRQSDHRQYDLSRIFAYREYLNQHNHLSSHPQSEGNSDQNHRQYDLSRIFANRESLNQHNHPPSEGNVAKLKKD